MSDASVDKARSQLRDLAASRMPDGSLTEDAKAILAADNSKNPVTIWVTNSDNINEQQAILRGATGAIDLPYNPNFHGSADGVEMTGYYILAHEFGHIRDFLANPQPDYIRFALIDDNYKYAREFAAVRVENQIRNIDNGLLRRKYSFGFGEQEDVPFPDELIHK